jgi:flagellar biosynthesis/type III secretory pathway protein FliH
MGRIVKATKAESAASCACPASADQREATFAEVTALLVSARAAANAEYAAAKDGAVVLARKMAEKIVGRAVEVDPSVMEEIVRLALGSLRARPGAIVVRVHPDDAQALAQSRGRLLRELDATADVRFTADPSVTRHGCVVDTPAGRLDARLETQLDAMEKALRERAGVRPAFQNPEEDNRGRR